MNLVEAIGMWAAVILYAASSVLYVVGVVFDRPRTVSSAGGAALGGLVVHLVAITARWMVVGHGPYLGFYEVASLMAFLSVAFFAWLAWRYPGLRVAGVAIMPVAFLILGGSMLASKDAAEVSGSLASFWLLIHVLFANLAYGSYAAAFALSSAFLLEEHGKAHRWRKVLDRLPEYALLDDLTFRFVGAGFLFQGVMIASGAIWANEAWGRYWGWDPMEIWSLLAWLVYAIYLHLRLTLGWQGRRAAWVAVISLPVIVFSLLGVPIVYDSIHAAYLSL